MNGVVCGETGGGRRKSNNDESRIPVLGPGLFQRSTSLRLRGERSSPPSFPQPTTDGAQSCTKIWACKPPSQYRSRSVSCSSHPLGTPSSAITSYPHTPTPSPEEAKRMDDDIDSLKSFGSVCSAMSCDHAYFARNGTTFSGRRMKYVVHCSPHMDGTEEYLTPTQRANRQIRRLKALLTQAQKDIEQKDQDIIRLTKEVVELRLCKAPLAVTQMLTDSTDNIVTTQTTDTSDGKEASLQEQPGGAAVTCDKDVSSDCEPHKASSSSMLLDNINTTSDIPSSLADSGHFEDMASSIHSKDSLTHLGQSPHSPGLAQLSVTHTDGSPSEDREGERTRIVTMYEKRLEEMQRNHVDECQEMKERHNDKVENLLQRLSDVNNRFCELRANYDQAQDKIRVLERETESQRRSMEEQEERHKTMYLKMYMKGQEAAKFEHADQVLEFAHRAPARVSVPELLQQLEVTENKLENIKDTDHQQTDKTKPALLSAKEAISLWILGTRKAMYRRTVDDRTGKGEMDPEVTLQFLKSAIYYFLTDKENHQGHLNAIESILGYNENERLNIQKLYRSNSKK